MQSGQTHSFPRDDGIAQGPIAAMPDGSSIVTEVRFVHCRNSGESVCGLEGRPRIVHVGNGDGPPPSFPRPPQSQHMTGEELLLKRCALSLWPPSRWASGDSRIGADHSRSSWYTSRRDCTLVVGITNTRTRVDCAYGRVMGPVACCGVQSGLIINLRGITPRVGATATTYGRYHSDNDVSWRGRCRPENASEHAPHLSRARARKLGIHQNKANNRKPCGLRSRSSEYAAVTILPRPLPGTTRHTALA